jgi:hypothetical protein
MHPTTLNIASGLLRSFITERLVMTVAALLRRDHAFSKKISSQLMHTGLAVLFVTISMGSALSPHATPPILMLASTWKWDLFFAFHFL